MTDKSVGEEEEQSVWDVPNTSGVLVGNGVVKAVSLSALIRALVGLDSSAQTFLDAKTTPPTSTTTTTTTITELNEEFTRKFLLCFHTFVQPVRIAEKFCAIINGPFSNSPRTTSSTAEPPPPPQPQVEEKRVTMACINVCKFVGRWALEWPSDFDGELLRLVRDLLVKASVKPGCEQIAKDSFSIVEKMVHCPDSPELTPVGSPIVKATPMNVPMDYVDPPEFWRDWPSSLKQMGRITPSDLAKHLTIIDWELQLTTKTKYRRILPKEMLIASNVYSRKVKNGDPNIRAIISRFNSIGTWVCSEILCQNSPKDRAETYGFFIKTAKYLRKLNNFQGMLAILSGFSRSCIERLHLTEQEVKGSYMKTKSELCTLFSSEGNQKVIRTILSQIPLNQPLVPYLGMVLTDLIFVGENPIKIGKLYNWRRALLIQQTIEQFLSHQSNGIYKLKSDSKLIALLGKLPSSMNQDDLQRRSLQLEPRNSNKQN